jgi:hypothetical protein
MHFSPEAAAIVRLMPREVGGSRSAAPSGQLPKEKLEAALALMVFPLGGGKLLETQPYVLKCSRIPFHRCEQCFDCMTLIEFAHKSRNEASNQLGHFSSPSLR